DQFPLRKIMQLHNMLGHEIWRSKHFPPKQAWSNSTIPYYSTKPGRTGETARSLWLVSRTQPGRSCSFSTDSFPEDLPELAAVRRGEIEHGLKNSLSVVCFPFYKLIPNIRQHSAPAKK
ncbi:hypothetical protein, partial [Rahnella woolbedingensis]|uniref:hypothetical protein n=1 Tax=Rahnella woolbedingensis TaxID=1510574 RepID=UPI001ABF06AD